MDIRHKVLNTNKMKWRRKDLRINATKSETILWEHLRNRLLGARFKRQYSVSNYVVDFYCHKAKLVIEIDGEIHQRVSNEKYDKYRTQYLESLGIKEIRFQNSEINNDLNKILSEIRKLLPSPEIRRGIEGEV